MNYLMKGLTLIEMIVAMLIGLSVIAIVSATFLRSNQTVQFNHQLGLMQESARIAMNHIAKDARMAGYTGCGESAIMANAIEANNRLDEWATSEHPVQGLNLSETTTRLDALATSESLVIFTLDSDLTFQITNHQTASNTMTLDNTADAIFAAGDAVGLFKQDCSQTAIVSLSSVSGTSVVHGTGSSGNFRNCFTRLKGSFRCYEGSAPIGSESFNPGFLKPLRSIAYFIGTDNGIPTLFRKEAGNRTPTPLVDGVEQLRVYYGLDNNGDGIANRFIRAGDRSFQHADWHNISSLRVHLITRSEFELTTTPRNYFFDGNLEIATDNFLRREYVMTFGLRNQG